jgi:hypothetical protein
VRARYSAVLTSTTNDVKTVVPAGAGYDPSRQKLGLSLIGANVPCGRARILHHMPMAHAIYAGLGLIEGRVHHRKAVIHLINAVCVVGCIAVC